MTPGWNNNPYTTDWITYFYGRDEVRARQGGRRHRLCSSARQPIVQQLQIQQDQDDADKGASALTQRGAATLARSASLGEKANAARKAACSA
jgi:hypothetical protein